ncbi:MAG: orotidine 5'-phosphate decarboxylase / HUMPS family protein, partial [Actinomycetota bacterium]|nr:orotidine 5'-phosphate decarboxylase / HUMPS family protein [Actinomycetota bacterium]
TVLTSIHDDDLAAIGVGGSSAAQVERLAKLAREAGVQGVVCSPLEAARMRELLGLEALVVTPGVRPAGSDAGDQSRIATPAQAVAAGASHLVIGRPITGSDEPGAAVDRIVSEG